MNSCSQSCIAVVSAFLYMQVNCSGLFQWNSGNNMPIVSVCFKLRCEMNWSPEATRTTGTTRIPSRTYWYYKSSYSSPKYLHSDHEMIITSVRISVQIRMITKLKLSPYFLQTYLVNWIQSGKVKFSPLQALEALRVVRGWGSHIF
jgi:hypothetical protein